MVRSTEGVVDYKEVRRHLGRVDCLKAVSPLSTVGFLGNSQLVLSQWFQKVHFHWHLTCRRFPQIPQTIVQQHSYS